MSRLSRCCKVKLGRFRHLALVLHPVRNTGASRIRHTGAHRIRSTGAHRIRSTGAHRFLLSLRRIVSCLVSRKWSRRLIFPGRVWRHPVLPHFFGRDAQALEGYIYGFFCHIVSFLVSRKGSRCFIRTTGVRCDTILYRIRCLFFKIKFLGFHIRHACAHRGFRPLFCLGGSKRNPCSFPGWEIRSGSFSSIRISQKLVDSPLLRG